MHVLMIVGISPEGNGCGARCQSLWVMRVVPVALLVLLLTERESLIAGREVVRLGITYGRNCPGVRMRAWARDRASALDRDPSAVEPLV